MRGRINMIDEIKRDILKIYYENEAEKNKLKLLARMKYS